MSVSFAVLLTAVGFNPSWPPDDPELPAEAYQSAVFMPDDPDYAPRVDGDSCVGQHELFSFTPACLTSIDDTERNKGLGAGIHADRAWAWTTGRGDVAIAIAADGVDWGDPEVVSRWRLDPGELQAPMTSTVGSMIHDRNDDGLFNVQDFTTATGTAAPTIDRVIDRRLLARADRGDTNGNGLLDPQDLIVIFSDGIDDDEDGYVDDIAGWDHLDDDNDAGAPIGASPHARWIVATANNGRAGAGVCPSCSAIPMRVGHEGRSQAHVVSLAILYAVDEGASVLGFFTAAIEATTFLNDAVDYAFREGRLIVATAGTHAGRTRPVAWNPDRVMVVGGIGFDAVDTRAATTALAPDPCSGFGPQLAAVAPARCNERGAALVAGAAGLLYAASKGIPERGIGTLDPPLGASEALQILSATADDVLRDEDTATTRLGWDERSGYGRINARRAVDAIIRRRVPPWTEITGPDWYEVVDPTIRDSVFVTATVLNPRLERVSWTLTAAPGIEPSLDGFRAIATGTLVAGEVAAIEGELDTTGLFADTAGRPGRYGGFAVTVKMTTRSSGGDEVVTGELRRVFLIHRDLELLPAFPIRLASGVVAAPRIMDVDGDGDLEVVVATVDGMLRVINRFGEIVAADVRTSPSARVRAHAKARAFTANQVSADVAQTIVAPLSGTGGDEPLVFVQTTEGVVVFANAAGEVKTVDSSSIARSARLPAGATSTPTIFDLDRDGAVDVIHTRPDGVFVESLDGVRHPGWPVTIDGVAGTPSVGDVDDDGEPEVVVVTGQRLYVIEANGTVSDGWPIELAGDLVRRKRRDVFAPSAALGDVDRDGQLDIVVALPGHPVRMIRGRTTVLVGTERSFGDGSDVPRVGPPLVAASNHVTLAALVGEEPPRPFVSTLAAPWFDGLSPRMAVERAVATFDPGGSFSSGFPRQAVEPGPLDALVADLDGDRRAEIVWSEGADRIYATAFDGRRPRSFPKLTGDEVIGTPAVEDLDGDGFLDLVAATRTGQIFVWRTRGLADGPVRWNGYHHDLAATGNISTSAFAREKIDTTGGCACRTEDRNGGLRTVLVLIGVMWFVRRRS